MSIDAKNASFSDSKYHIIAGFNFYNNSVRYCSLSPGSAGLPYASPGTDQFNTTLGFMERYQRYTNDPQVQEMITLLEKVCLDRNATETLGHITLTIQSTDIITTYSFLNTYNGAQYTGITISYGNKIENFNFNDNRQSQKIGDVNINVSKEQAIGIAEKYLKNYSFNTTFSNGTTVRVSNLNVTGVYQTTLQTTVRENNTLYPLWNIQFNISNMPTPGLQGVGVWVWANDGIVIGAYNYAYPLNFDPLDFLLLPILLSALAPLATLIFIIVAVVVVLVLYLRKNKEAAPGMPPSKGNF